MVGRKWIFYFNISKHCLNGSLNGRRSLPLFASLLFFLSSSWLSFCLLFFNCIAASSSTPIWSFIIFLISTDDAVDGDIGCMIEGLSLFVLLNEYWTLVLNDFKYVLLRRTYFVWWSGWWNVDEILRHRFELNLVKHATGRRVSLVFETRRQILFESIFTSKKGEKQIQMFLNLFFFLL